MRRNANYALLGYKYQFLKTLYEVLNSNDRQIITCEQFEDIDIDSSDYEMQIQCKYHGAAEKYTLGKIYKPLLEFMCSYATKSSTKNVCYRLFAYFPNVALGINVITEDDCKKALSSANKDLKNLIAKINTSKISIKDFISHLTVEFGCDIDKLESKVVDMLLMNAFSDDEVSQYVLSNGITVVLNKSCMQDESERKITKQELLEKLRSTKTVMMNKWINEFYSLEKFLAIRRAAIKDSINRRHCNRTFIFPAELCLNKSEFINFVKSLQEKIHSHTKHHINNVLILALDLEANDYTEILKSLLSENMEIHTGYRIDEFNECEFLTPPALDMNRIAVRGIPIRIIQLEHAETLNKIKPDVYYFFGSNGRNFNIDVFSITCEELPILTYNQIKYVFSMRGVSI